MTIYAVLTGKEGKPNVDFAYDSAKVLFPFEDGYALYVIAGPHEMRARKDADDARVDFCPKGDLMWREGQSVPASIVQRVFAGVLSGKIGPVAPPVPRPKPHVPAAPAKV